MADSPDVVVVGAGVIGSAIAYYLSIEGAKVVLLEQEAIGSGASAHATGSMNLLGTEFTPGPSFEMGLESYRMFADLVPRLEEDTGMDLLCQRKPSLRLALEESEEILIKDLMVWQQEYVPISWIDGEEVRRLEPRLSPGGPWCGLRRRVYPVRQLPANFGPGRGIRSSRCSDFPPAGHGPDNPA